MGSQPRGHSLPSEANADARHHRLPADWELAPYAGDDLRGTSLRGANMLLPFPEVYAMRAPRRCSGQVSRWQTCTHHTLPNFHEGAARRDLGS
jgi:hypothetical protein